MTDTLQQALDTPGCERLRDFAAVGPAQRAALELFVDRLRAADQQTEPVAWAISYDGVQPYSLWDYGDGPLLDLEVKQMGGAAKKMPLYTAPLKAAPEATQYIALCDAMGYNERKDNLTSPEEHAQSLLAEIKRLKERAAPMTEEEILVRFDEIVNARAHDSKVILFARLIEARKARPMTDEEMIIRGWRQCAVGQRTTQYCGQLEAAVAAERERVTFEMVNEAQRAVQEAAAAEREACAKVLDDWKKHNWTFEDCAAVVRARGEK